MSTANEKRLKEIFAKIFLKDENEIDDQLSRRDVEEWDSMGHLMLITEIESTYGVFVSDEDMTKIKTVGDIKQLLKKLGVSI